MMTYTYWGMGNCAHIKSIPSYEKAKEHYDSITPIRGSNPEVRPLGGKRRYAWYQIKKNQRVVNDGFLGQYITTYSCNLYGSDCVEFYPDGSVAIRTFGWQTPTTQAFINYVTKEFGHIESVKGKWYWKQAHDSKMFFIRRETKSEVILKPDAEGKLVVDNPCKEKRFAINRKAMNAVRNRYKFFQEYCSVMLAMNNAITKEDYEIVANQLQLKTSSLLGKDYHWSQHNPISKQRDEFFDNLNKVTQTGDLDLMYSLAIHACYSFGSWSYIKSMSECSPEKFNRQWNELLKYKFFNEVTVANDVEAGVGFKDSNTKYIA